MDPTDRSHPIRASSNANGDSENMCKQTVSHVSMSWVMGHDSWVMSNTAIHMCKQTVTVIAYIYKHVKLITYVLLLTRTETAPLYICIAVLLMTQESWPMTHVIDTWLMTRDTEGDYIHIYCCSRVPKMLPYFEISKPLSNKWMKFQNMGALPVQIAPLWISQPRKQNQSIAAHAEQHAMHFGGMHCITLRLWVCVCVRERHTHARKHTPTLYESEHNRYARLERQ